MPLNLDGFTAHICCDGVELEMYDIQKEDDKTITCWIPSEEGKVRSRIAIEDAVQIRVRGQLHANTLHQKFTLHWSDESAATKAQIDGYVDGRRVCRTVHRDQVKGCCDGLYTVGQTRPFVFSPLILTGKCSVSLNMRWLT